MKRITIILGLSLALFSHGAVCEEDAKRVQAKLEALEESLQNIEDEILQTTKVLSKQQRKLAQIDASINQTTLEVRNTKQKIVQIKPELEALEIQVDELEKEKQALLERLSLYIQKLNQNHRRHPLKIILSQNKISDVQKLSIWYEYVAKAESEILQEVKIKAQNSQQAKQALELKSNKLVSLKAALKTQQQSLEKKRASQNTLIYEYQNKLNHDKNRERELKERHIVLLQLLDKLEKASKLEYIDLPKRFDKMQGKLPLPINARHIERIQFDRSLLHAKEGTIVQAIHPGRVVFSEWLRGLGLLIIIDHGHGYMSLYGNNQTLLKSTGDWVDRGEQISLVGKSGGVSNPGLYFEIRKEGKPLNTQKWTQNS